MGKTDARAWVVDRWKEETEANVQKMGPTEYPITFTDGMMLLRPAKSDPGGEPKTMLDELMRWHNIVDRHTTSHRVNVLSFDTPNTPLAKAIEQAARDPLDSPAVSFARSQLTTGYSHWKGFCFHKDLPFTEDHRQAVLSPDRNVLRKQFLSWVCCNLLGLLCREDAHSWDRSELIKHPPDRVVIISGHCLQAGDVARGLPYAEFRCDWPKNPPSEMKEEEDVGAYPLVVCLWDSLDPKSPRGGVYWLSPFFRHDLGEGDFSCFHFHSRLSACLFGQGAQTRCSLAVRACVSTNKRALDFLVSERRGGEWQPRLAMAVLSNDTDYFFLALLHWQLTGPRRRRGKHISIVIDSGARSRPETKLVDVDALYNALSSDGVCCLELLIATYAAGGDYTRDFHSTPHRWFLEAYYSKVSDLGRRYVGSLVNAGGSPSESLVSGVEGHAFVRLVKVAFWLAHEVHGFPPSKKLADMERDLDWSTMEKRLRARSWTPACDSFAAKIEAGEIPKTATGRKKPAPPGFHAQLPPAWSMMGRFLNLAYHTRMALQVGCSTLDLPSDQAGLAQFGYFLDPRYGKVTRRIDEIPPPF